MAFLINMHFFHPLYSYCYGKEPEQKQPKGTLLVGEIPKKGISQGEAHPSLCRCLDSWGLPSCGKLNCISYGYEGLLFPVF